MSNWSITVFSKLDTTINLRYFIGEDKKIYAETCVPDKYEGFPKVAFGGATASILDIFTSSTAYVNTDGFCMLATKNLDVKYIKFLPVNKPFKIECETIKQDKSHICVTAKILDIYGNNIYCSCYASFYKVYRASRFPKKSIEKLKSEYEFAKKRINEINKEA